MMFAQSPCSATGAHHNPKVWINATTEDTFAENATTEIMFGQSATTENTFLQCETLYMMCTQSPAAHGPRIVNHHAQRHKHSDVAFFNVGTGGSRIAQTAF